MKREVFLSDLNRAHVFHAIEASPDEWYWTEPGMSGIAQGNRQALISWVDNKIGTLDYGDIEVSPPLSDRDGPCHFDQTRRNLWIEDEYLAPHEYLVRLIPELRPLKGTPGHSAGCTCTEEMP